MDAENAASPTTETQRNPNQLEELSKDEIINKYNKLLAIAKKAKQAKDELAEKNRELKDALQSCEKQKAADKQALLTMKEMVEQFTENKLELTTQLNGLQQKRKTDGETITKLSIENEAQRRQIDRLNEDNESLLKDVDQMEERLKQVTMLGKGQEQDLRILEAEVIKFQEDQLQNSRLQSKIKILEDENAALKEQAEVRIQEMEVLNDKYKCVKDFNTEQRKKLISLKDRYLEIQRKLKKLKECKQILLETQKEYGEAVSKWQKEIVYASNLLCKQMNALKEENQELIEKLKTVDNDKNSTVNLNLPENIDLNEIADKMGQLQKMSEMALTEKKQITLQLQAALEENKSLKEKFMEAIHQSGIHQSKQGSSQDTNLTGNVLQEVEEKNFASIQLSHEVENLKTNLATTDDQQLGEMGIELSQAQNMEQSMQIVLKEFEEYKRTYDEAGTQRLNTIAEQSNELVKLREERRTLQIDCKSLKQELQELKDKNPQQNEEIVELKKMLDHLRDSTKIHLEQNALDHQTLLSRYEQKEREHNELLDEMRELNEVLKARGDAISRQQEKQQELMAELKTTRMRLKEVEEQFNEKDKRFGEKEEQVREVCKEMDEAREKLAEMSQACSRHELQLRTLTEELRCTCNNEISVADAQSDVLSTSTISRSESNRLHEVDESFEEKYNKLRSLAIKLKKKLQDKTTHVWDLEKQLNINENSTAKKDNEKLNNELVLKEKEIQSLKAENQKLKVSRKQANLLNLEIEAAEKGLREMTAKLTAKTSELEDLTAILITKESVIVQLRKEIAILELAKEAECQHSKELMEQIDRLQTQIKNTVNSQQHALTANKELEQSLEALKLEKEELRIQLSSSASKYEATLSAIQKDKLALEQQSQQTEEKLHSTEESLKTVNRVLEDLRVEYLDYKVKAQAVLLRKNMERRNSTKEREIEEELMALRTNEDKMKANTQILLNKLETSSRELVNLEEEKLSLEKRNGDLLKIIEELRQQNEFFALENRSQLEIEKETLQKHREQLESINKSHLEQMQELETSYQKQINQLKSEFTKTARMPTIIGALTATNSTLGTEQQQQKPTVNSEESKIDFLLMEREDGEGSEEAVEAMATLAAGRKISLPSQRSQHDFIPLYELLNAPMSAISDTVTKTNISNFEAAAVNDVNEHDVHSVELCLIKERLQKQESHVRHLTALLAENEQDLAKLTQMNDVLKEELRRHERAVEREPHMHNSEYLKNVIIKFLTLNNCDEKQRLVPVLNTILKLSRSETEILNCVAKGQKVAPESSNRGWSGLLTSWGSNNSN